MKNNIKIWIINDIHFDYKKMIDEKIESWDCWGDEIQEFNMNIYLSNRKLPDCFMEFYPDNKLENCKQKAICEFNSKGKKYLCKEHLLYYSKFLYLYLRQKYSFLHMFHRH